jgi:methylated-DNA-[protein]-cysteine S-methyltransferase
MSQIFHTNVESPAGRLLLASNNDGLLLLSFAAGKRPVLPHPDWSPDKAPFVEVIRQLRAYFGGELTKFDVRLALQGTPFQLRVWQALCAIPYGTTISYGDLAKQIGQPKAVRAVGLANGANPVAIIVPCHRVIGSNGKLTGYGGGLPLKERLLALESRQQHLIYRLTIV